VKAKVMREQFRGRALGAAAGKVNWHSSGFGVSCVEPRGSFTIFVMPGQQLGPAAQRIGEWLVRENLHGEIDLVEAGVPHAL
jgi:hypothetical protein